MLNPDTLVLNFMDDDGVYTLVRGILVYHIIYLDMYIIYSWFESICYLLYDVLISSCLFRNIYFSDRKRWERLPTTVSKQLKEVLSHGPEIDTRKSMTVEIKMSFVRLRIEVGYFSDYMV